MDSNWLSHGGRLESFVFVSALFLFALLETLRPLRPAGLSTSRRWFNHGVLLVLNSGVNILLFRGGAVAFAVLVSSRHWGLSNQVGLFYALRFVLGFVAADLVHYASHYIYHQVPILWRVHRVHHTDPEFDVTTGFRFHPLEAVLTQGCNLAVIALLGSPPLAVLGAEVLTLFQDLFEHANVEIPARLDGFLRTVLATPNMHRVHHSVEIAQQNRNFGTIFTWWDRLFGTYAPRATTNLKEMEIGLAGYPEQESASILRTLTLPFEP